jgi:uncharacterized protein (DUF927 family)
MSDPDGPGSAGAKRNGKAAGLRLVRASIAKAAPLPGIEHVRMPFGFEMREDGLWRLARKAEETDMRLCGPLEVLAESRPETGDEWGLFLRWRDRDGTPHEWLMPRRMLAGEAVAVREKLASCGLYVATLDHARRALVQFLAEVATERRVRTVPRCGWHGQPPRVYVLPDAVFGTVPEGERLYLDLDPRPTIFRMADSLDGWKAEVSALCVGNSRLLFAVSAAFAAPLLPLLGEEGGGINLRGESSKGKTTIIDVAASVWEAPSKTGPDAFVRPWRATANAIEWVAQSHNHALLPMDELGQAEPREIGETLYMLANGAGKERARTGGGTRPKATWSTLVLSSSEESAAALAQQAGKRLKAGQEVRLLDIPAVVERGHGAFEALHTEATKAETGADFARRLREGTLRHHGHAIRAFLAWLTGKLAENPDFIARALHEPARAWERRNVPPGADGQVLRAARRFALLAVAGELASKAKVTGWPAGAADAAAAAVFRDWLAERGGIGAREDQHLFAALRRFIVLHGAARFETARDPATLQGGEDFGAQVEPPLAEGARVIQRAGWRWEEAGPDGVRSWVYGIDPEVFAAEVCAPLGLGELDAAKRLARAGLIRTAREGAETRYRVRMPWRAPGAGRPRLIVVEPKLLAETGAD